MAGHPQEEVGNPKDSSLSVPQSSSTSTGNYKTSTVAIKEKKSGMYLVLEKHEGECKVGKSFIARIFKAESQEVLNKILLRLEKMCNSNKAHFINGVSSSNRELTELQYIDFNGPFIKLEVDFQRPSPHVPQEEISICPKEGKIFSEKQLKLANDELLSDRHPEPDVTSIIQSFPFSIYNTPNREVSKVLFKIRASKLAYQWSKPSEQVDFEYSTFILKHSSQEEQGLHSTNKYRNFSDYIKEHLKDDIENIIAHLFDNKVLTENEKANLLKTNLDGEVNLVVQKAELLLYLQHRSNSLGFFLEALEKSVYDSNHKIAEELRKPTIA